VRYGDLKRELGIPRPKLSYVLHQRCAVKVGEGNKREYSQNDLDLLKKYFEAKKRYDEALLALDREFGEKV
jgi:hypothetical protein